MSVVSKEVLVNPSFKGNFEGSPERILISRPNPMDQRLKRQEENGYDPFLCAQSLVHRLLVKNPKQIH